MPVALTPLRHTARRIRPKALLDGFANALWRQNGIFLKILIENENQKPYCERGDELMNFTNAKFMKKPDTCGNVPIEPIETIDTDCRLQLFILNFSNVLGWLK